MPRLGERAGRIKAWGEHQKYKYGIRHIEIDLSLLGKARG